VEIRYDSGSKKHGDIDFLAFKDGYLFVAECKDSTHPTDLYELRTTYNYVQKASSQLEHIMAAVSDSAYLKIFQQQTGINPVDIKAIVPTVILSNRKFWGYMCNGFPIRNIKEIIGFLATGEWNFRLPDGDLYKFKLWAGEKFQPEDLTIFCGGESPHKKLGGALKEYELKLSSNIFQRRYSLDLPKVIEIFKEHYKYKIVTGPIEER
jgi:hypothetical protein